MSSDSKRSLDSQESKLPEPAHADDDNPTCESSRDVGLRPERRSTSTRRGIRIVTLVAALTCLSAAGYSIAQSLREADWLLALAPQAGGDPRDQAKAQAAAALAAEDPSERCELQVFSQPPGGESIVYLTAPGQIAGFRPGHFGNHSRLAREIVRQAVLLAAREELNVTVRDASIGDPAPAGQPSAVVEVAALCPREKMAIRLSRVQGENREVLFERTLRDNEKLNDYLTLTRNAEVAARDGLPEVLGKLGVKAKPVPKKGDTRLPSALEAQLLKMSFLEQFAAVRQLHEWIRTEGSSPWRLHGLARGYANLGVLTDYQWDGAGQAYKARALLYIQRDVAARPGAPVTRWNRAYVAALAGIHILALNDLDAASRFAKGMAESVRPTPPPWVELVEAHCHSAAEKLAQLRQGSINEVGALFYLMTVEHPSNTDIALCAAREAIVANPENFRAHDALCEVGGVANLHVATTAAPLVLTELIPKRVAALSGVPDAVRKAVEDKQDEVTLTRALDAASDPVRDRAEPSWGALARIIRETRFNFTYRRIEFMVNHWSVPADEYWQEARPLVAEHRFRPFLEELARPSQDRSEFLPFAEKLDTTDFGLNSLPLERMAVAKMPPDQKPSYYGTAVFLADWNHRDLAMAAFRYRSTRAVDYARKLLMVSPHSAYAMGMLVEHGWGEAEKHVAEWRKQVGDHPSLIGPLARRYDELGRTEEADGLLKRYLELSPDLWAYRLLADRAKGRGDLIRWKSILDDYLDKEEDHGLDHAKVRVEVAEFLMSKGLYGEAQPYAEAAAETWAGWAMQTAQRCAEGQEDWDAAEKWARNRALRYPNASAYDWVDFCVRTGEGHLQEACDFTLLALDRLNDRTDDQIKLMRSALLMAKRTPDKAFESLHQVIKASAADPANHQLAMVTLLTAAGQAADLKLFATTAEQFIDKYAADSPKFTAILSKLREAIAKETPDALDTKGLDALIEETPSNNRTVPALVVASYLAGAGKPEMAKPYWKLAADKGQSYFWWRLIAEAQLRRPQSP